jgi:hypothetical protein
VNDLDNSPPRRSQDRLQAWVDAFKQEGHLYAGTVSVASQEDDDEQDTGLVIMRLANVPASVSLQPRSYDNPYWEATLTGWETDQTLSPHQLASLAAELVVAQNLCTYLQWRSLEWDRESGNH